MGATSLVWNYIEGLEKGTVFVTRELLAFGSRDAVDKALQRMVHEGGIRRLARGVFVGNEDGMKSPSLRAIVEAKARAFAKVILPSSAARGKEFRSLNRGEKKHNFVVLGTPSSFSTVRGRVFFRKISPRKYFLALFKAGRFLLAAWQRGKQAVKEAWIKGKMKTFKGSENNEILHLAGWTPRWLNEMIREIPPRAKASVKLNIVPFEYARLINLAKT